MLIATLAEADTVIAIRIDAIQYCVPKDEAGVTRVFLFDTYFDIRMSFHMVVAEIQAYEARGKE